MTLILMKAKNYYNRKAFRYNSVTEYIENGAEIVDTIYEYDFNPNDSIWSSIIVNTPESNYDYLLTIDDAIVSRWYVLEANRKRAGQYQLKLLRDVIADYYEDVINAPTFIEKATVKYGNSLLFNNEEMTFNQIKTQEVLLKDRSLCPWIVGYINRETPLTTITTPTKNFYTETYETIEELPYYNMIGADGKFRGTYSSTFAAKIGYISGLVGVVGNSFESHFNTGGLISKRSEWLDDTLKYRRIRTTTGTYYEWHAGEAYAPIAAIGSNYLRVNLGQFNDAVADELTNVAVDSTLSSFLKEYSVEGRTVRIGDKFYKVRRDEGTVEIKTINPSSTDSALYSIMNSMTDLMTDVIHKIPSFNDYSNNYMATYKEQIYSLIIEETEISASYKVDIPASTVRNHLDDAPYDMFAIPYNYQSKLSYSYQKPEGGFGTPIPNVDYEASMAIASKISQTLASNLIDLQLLPYCPIQGWIDSVGSLLSTEQHVLDRDYSIIYDTTLDPNDPKECSIVLWCTSSELSFSIDKTHEQTANGGFTNRPIDIIVDEDDAKVQALCDMYRLVSPNYDGQFEFNPVKNNGVEYFTVDATYKPYTPYIRVAPNFKGLYGGDFNDARGLICGGDFSLPTTTDQWKQYEINNKNYLNAFNRQIENMEINNKYQRIGEIIGATTGAISTGVTAGMTGGMMSGGNPYVAAGSAVGGTVLSGIGGAVDVGINDKLRTEALDFTKDQFGYQLGNIRALPYSLNRVSAFNINNKIFPILEYYTCTDIEKQALRDKIKYNGMTIQTIGTVAQYLQEEPTYIKGRVIRIEDLGEDYHLAVAIAEELYKGVFI